MAWETIASGTTENFANAIPSIDHLDAGDKGRIVFYDIPAYGWKTFDVIGAEYVAQYFTPAGVQVTDVYGHEGNGYVEFTVTGTPVLPIIAAVAALIVALGLLGVFITIALQIERIDISLFTWQVIIVIIVMVIAVAATTIFVARAAFK